MTLGGKQETPLACSSFGCPVALDFLKIFQGGDVLLGGARVLADA